MSSCPSNEPASTGIRAFLTAHRDGFASLEDMATAIDAYNRLRRRSRNLTGLRKNVRQRDDGRWHWHGTRGSAPTTMNPNGAPTATDSGWPHPRSRSPILIVRGLHSDVVSDAGIEETQRLIRQAQIVEVPQAGHMVAGDDNDVFAT